MPFPERVRRKEIEKATNCAICRDPFPPDAYIEVHSATSLHLVLDEKSEPAKYIVTDPPRGHEALRGRSISLRVFSPGEIKQNDAYCVCPVCHDEVKRIALAESRHIDPNFKGNAPLVWVLAKVTVDLAKRGKPIIYNVVS